jgi:hypothetical protein
VGERQGARSTPGRRGLRSLIWSRFTWGRQEEALKFFPFICGYINGHGKPGPAGGRAPVPDAVFLTAWDRFTFIIPLTLALVFVMFYLNNRFMAKVTIVFLWSPPFPGLLIYPSIFTVRSGTSR